MDEVGAEWSLREKQKVAEIAEKGGGPTLPPVIVGPSVTFSLFRYSFPLFKIFLLRFSIFNSLDHMFPPLFLTMVNPFTAMLESS